MLLQPQGAGGLRLGCHHAESFGPRERPSLPTPPAIARCPISPLCVSPQSDVPDSILVYSLSSLLQGKLQESKSLVWLLLGPQLLLSRWAHSRCASNDEGCPLPAGGSCVIAKNLQEKHTLT